MLHVFAIYTTVCNFSWMFCEGLYLHLALNCCALTPNRLEEHWSSYAMFIFIGWSKYVVLFLFPTHAKLLSCRRAYYNVVLFRVFTNWYFCPYLVLPMLPTTAYAVLRQHHILTEHQLDLYVSFSV